MTYREFIELLPTVSTFDKLWFDVINPFRIEGEKRATLINNLIWSASQNNMQEVIESSKLSAYYIAKTFEYSERTVYSWANGSRKPSDSVTRMIAFILIDDFAQSWKQSLEVETFNRTMKEHEELEARWKTYEDEHGYPANSAAAYMEAHPERVRECLDLCGREAYQMKHYDSESWSCAAVILKDRIYDRQSAPSLWSAIAESNLNK